MIFNDAARTTEQHLHHLQSRGLIIDNEKVARHTLKHANYYRLANYIAPFLEQNKRFIQGTRFEDVIALYDFDKALRQVVLESLGRLELSFRATFAYHLSYQLGAHAYLDAQLFDKQQTGITKALKKEARRSKDPAFLAYYQQYPAPPNPESPPIWLVCELMSFGQVSKSFQNLQSKRVRKKIAAEYDVPTEIYGSFLNQASNIRNICAHHARLWNREFTFLFQLPKKRPVGWVDYFDRRSNAKGNLKNRQLYNSLVMMCYLMYKVEGTRVWQGELESLLATHHDKLAAMGFPRHWRKLKLWQNLADIY